MFTNNICCPAASRSKRHSVSTRSTESQMKSITCAQSQSVFLLRMATRASTSLQACHGTLYVSHCSYRIDSVARQGGGGSSIWRMLESIRRQVRLESILCVSYQPGTLASAYVWESLTTPAHREIYRPGVQPKKDH